MTTEVSSAPVINELGNLLLDANRRIEVLEDENDMLRAMDGMQQQEIARLNEELAKARPDWKNAPEHCDRLVGHWQWMRSYYSPVDAGYVEFYRPEKP